MQRAPRVLILDCAFTFYLPFKQEATDILANSSPARNFEESIGLYTRRASLGKLLHSHKTRRASHESFHFRIDQHQVFAKHYLDQFIFQTTQYISNFLIITTIDEPTPRTLPKPSICAQLSDPTTSYKDLVDSRDRRESTTQVWTWMMR